MGDAINSADDIRALGWAVAVHNDYRLDGVRHTFWLFTKGDKCVKGEGHTDGEALNEVRAQLQARSIEKCAQPFMEHAEYGSMRPAASVLRDLAACGREYMPKTHILAAAQIIEDQSRTVIDLRCALACATCLWKSTPEEPCPYLQKCCYALKTGIGEGENNFWSGVESDLP